jgi:hypothetical protein
MEKSITVPRAMRVRISCAWARKKLELHGFIDNSIHIRISGCLQ